MAARDLRLAASRPYICELKLQSETTAVQDAASANHESIPGLTLSQRYHFDAFGFVLLPGALDPELVERLRAALERVRTDPDLAARRVYSNRKGAHFLQVGNLVEYDRAFLDYAACPNLTPLVEEVVGGAVRLEETEAIINRRDPSFVPAGKDVPAPVGFHSGARHGWGTYEEQNRFHCLFVKTLAYLTDVGPRDGGTAVIPGSHRLSWRQSEIIEAATKDPSLIRQVCAEAGDVMLFAESLVHSTTQILSDRERMIMVAGYTPTMVREWMGNEVSSEFVQTLPESIRPLISGSDNWNWRRRYPG